MSWRRSRPAPSPGRRVYTTADTSYSITGTCQVAQRRLRRGREWLVVLAHTLVALPFVVRSVLPALRSIHPRLHEAAALVGASPWRVWREVDLPIVARAVLVGAMFAFTVSMGEFGATSLIARPERPTMPIAIYRFLGRPGAANYGQALAMSTLLMLARLIVAPSVKLSLQTGTTISGIIVHCATGRCASAFHELNWAC
jgi:ABC-type spermidine/putrescine transport system permease subunit II